MQAIAVLMVIDELHRLFLRFGAHDAKHGPENLFLIDAHVLRHIVKQAGAEEEAVFVIGNHKVPTIS